MIRAVRPPADRSVAAPSRSARTIDARPSYRPSPRRRPARVERRRPRSSSSTRASCHEPDRHAAPAPTAPQADGHLPLPARPRARLARHRLGRADRVRRRRTCRPTSRRISITLNIDSFEHLEFETRPDQLLVYTLVQGDERVIVEFAPIGPADEDASHAPRQLEFDTSGYVQMELLGMRRPRTTRPSGPARGRARRRARRGRTGCPAPPARRRACAAPRATPARPRSDHEQVRQHLRGRTSPTGRPGTGSRRRGSSSTPWMSRMNRKIAPKR